MPPHFPESARTRGAASGLTWTSPYSPLSQAVVSDRSRGQRDAGGDRPVESTARRTPSAREWTRTALPASTSGRDLGASSDAGSVPSWLDVQAVQCLGFFRWQ